VSCTKTTSLSNIHPTTAILPSALRVLSHGHPSNESSHTIGSKEITNNLAKIHRFARVGVCPAFQDNKGVADLNFQRHHCFVTNSAK
jgi:hypothetical protein